MATKRLIDANVAIERAKDSDRIVGSSIWETGEVVEFLEDCPIVDAVEVVHGRWLYDSGSERYFCSVCNENALHTSRDEPVYDYDWEENLRYSYTETIIEEHLTNYCPNCGAKMDGDGNA